MKSQNMLSIKTMFLLVEQTKPYYQTIHSSIYETSINTDVKITWEKKKNKQKDSYVISLEMIIYRWQRYHKDEFFKISVLYMYKYIEIVYTDMIHCETITSIKWLACDNRLHI